VSDTTLARRVCAGESAAFDEFFVSYFPRLFHFALARLNGNEDAAEEVVQCTLIRGLDRLNSFRGDSTLLTWLCTLCRHEIADWTSRHGRHREISLSDDHETARVVLDSLISGDSDAPDRALQRREVSRLVHSTLDQLPERYSEVLEWKYMDNLTVEEVAQRLGIGYKAAESLLTRARAAFREGFSELAGRWPSTSTPAHSGDNS
jgi:RNA polymerase sigma-70 factor (ECF subfamily)